MSLILTFFQLLIIFFIVYSPIIPNDEWTSKFTIKAERLGLSKLIIQSQSELVRSVQSSPIEIQVYYFIL